MQSSALSLLVLMMIFDALQRSCCQGWMVKQVRPMKLHTRPLSGIDKSLEGSFLTHWQTMNVSPKATILLSVSGGADSIAMLHLIQKLKIKHLPDLDLKVVCFNHQMRAAAEIEASFVEATAKQYGMDVFLRVWPNDLKRGSNFQDSARVWRKSEALSIINNINNNFGKFISTGHHLDDQLETIVMKLLRGTFIANIRGMVNNDGTFIKPLLPFRKYELVSYLQAHSFEWKEDSSNQSRDYKRNKVRLDLMPLLSDIAGGEAALENRLTSLVDQSNQVKSLLESQTRVYGDFLEYHKYGDGYRTLLFKQEPKNIPLLMLHEVIHKWIYSSCGINLSYPILQKVVNLLYILGSRKSVSATISKDWDVCLVGRELRLMKRFQQFFMDSCKSTLDLSGHDVLITHPPFLRFSAEPLDGDYRKISFPFPNDNPKCDVSVRFAREGEKLPSKYGRGQKISTLAINNGVPSSERDRVLLFAHHDQPLLIALPHKVIIASDYLQQPQDNPVGLHWVTFYMKLDRNDSVPTEPSQILHG